MCQRERDYYKGVAIHCDFMLDRLKSERNKNKNKI